MLVPSKKNRTLLDVMIDPFDVLADVQEVMPKPNSLLMKTDIREKDGSYELDIDLPGYKKKDISVEIKEGYLTISASKESETEDKDERGTFIRKERFSGKSSRSFYIGEDVNDDDIKAKFEDGVLKIIAPKKIEQPKVEEKKTITIEG